MYIGPQGIVHGTYSTILNAGRTMLGIPHDKDLKGYLFVSSGLGGMSGAQGKSVEIANGVAIIAEVDYSRVKTRKEQGWIGKVSDNAEKAFAMAKEYQDKKEGIAIAFHGNIVDLLEYAVDHNIKIDLLSDQTSCHAAYSGGYCPQGLTFKERTQLLASDREKFCRLVDKSLRRHFELINTLVNRGVYFFDYGNSFLKAVFDAGVKEVSRNGLDAKDGFIFPKPIYPYGVQDYMVRAKWQLLYSKKPDFNSKIWITCIIILFLL